VIGALAASLVSSAGASDFTAIVIEDVLVDPGNVFGAGDLTFLFQVTNNGPSPIGRITVSSFAGSFTDVGVNTGFAPPGFVVNLNLPSTVDRDVSGAIIGFNYPSGLAGGLTSAILEIQTNATTFRSGFGFISVINEGAATAGSFGPTPGAVPEPATWAMMLLGFVGLGFAFRHSRRKVSFA
jgi:hypothetical protein